MDIFKTITTTSPNVLSDTKQAYAWNTAKRHRRYWRKRS